ncbi:hypothetical protein [Flavobacterium sp.]|uniref:hypothetical protein n=1 Tax=Flavobacterium sp. TaxID=239 RepID=UPI0025E3C085|nr:hypothetical protein [Flavobacterium sp.]
MKHSLLFLILVGGLFFSCSNENSSTNSQTIEKIISYIPQQANFQTKIISYYDTENRSTLDSVFDANNNFVRKRQYVYSSQSRTTNTFDNLNVLTKIIIVEYDSTGRLTTVTSYDASGNINFKYAYDYDDVNHTVTKNKVEGSTITPVFFFKVNSTGMIYYQQNILNNNSVTQLNYVGNKPISMFFDNPINLLNFNYYSILKPMNLRISDVQKNNKVLDLGIEHMAFNADYYFSDYADSYFIQYTFDVNDYPLTAHELTPLTGSSMVEDFYYYN